MISGLPLLAQNTRQIELSVSTHNTKLSSTGMTESVPSESLKINFSEANHRGFSLGFAIPITKTGSAQFRLGGHVLLESSSKSDATVTYRYLYYGRWYSESATKAFDTAYSRMALSAEWLWDKSAQFGGALDLCQESIKLKSDLDASATLTRPWARLFLGKAFKSNRATPFFRLNVAFPLTSTDAPDPNATSTDPIAKAMAPKLDLSLQVGIAF